MMMIMVVFVAHLCSGFDVTVLIVVVAVLLVVGTVSIVICAVYVSSSRRKSKSGIQFINYEICSDIVGCPDEAMD